MRHTLTLALLVAAPLQAQGYVGGLVLDSATNAPLPCVQVGLVDTAGHILSQQVTAPDGMFQLDAPPTGTYRLRFFIWMHEPMLGPAEELEPTVERARKYALHFRVDSELGYPKGDTALNAPPSHRRNSAVVPQYPLGLRMSGVQGDVTVDFLVDSAGVVAPSSVKVTRSSHHEFTDAVTQYLQKVRLRPARLDGRSVCALMRDWPFTFRLGPDR